MTPVKALSGGECNRLLLARLFKQPANLLVLDEPTNDLDIETLELLEELLGEFKGTLLIVSHDREFLDNVVTSTLIFEGEGRIQEYVGGYHDWLRQVKTEKTEAVKKIKNDKPVSRSKKLSYKEQKELAELPGLIEKLELEQAQLQRDVSSEVFYQKDQAEIKGVFDRVREVEGLLEEAYRRWGELE
jgi:ABC transport system ATP-binding/permease protein